MSSAISYTRTRLKMGGHREVRKHQNQRAISRIQDLEQFHPSLMLNSLVNYIFYMTHFFVLRK